MATAAKSGPQDMPPKGGYSPYQIERVPLRTVIGDLPLTDYDFFEHLDAFLQENSLAPKLTIRQRRRTGFAIFLTCTFGGLYLYGQTYKRIKIEELEMRSARHALQPMMEAERDRAILKHMRRLRDEEADLMKKFPGWEVGKFFSEPIFNTLQDDTFVEPTFNELTVHSNPEEYKAHVLRAFFS